MSDVLDYDQLVKDYYENLHTKLRNFRPGPEYLESWVHDENHNRSIVGIFEAAEENGREALSLRIGRELSDGVDRDWLREHLGRIGELSFDEEGPALHVHLAFGGRGEEPTIHPAYRKALEAAARSLRWEGTLGAPTGMHRLVRVTSAGVTLSLFISEEGLLKEARHSGARGVAVPLLDQFCDRIRGLPLQEAAEHGVLGLERDLRDRTVAPPVPGLVTPENADPAFRVPTALIRMAYETYLETMGRSRERNHFERPVSAGWARLSTEAQIDHIRAIWQALCAQRQLPYGDMAVLAVKGGTRVVLSGAGPFQGKELGHDLMELERALQERLEPRLEITLESIEDRNRREQRTKRDPMATP